MVIPIILPEGTPMAVKIIVAAIVVVFLLFAVWGYFRRGRW